MRLYGLVKNLGSTDDLHRQSVDILCALNHTSGKAIRAFVSRLDAKLMTRSRGLEEYRVVPLRTIDPNSFIQEHQGRSTKPGKLFTTPHFPTVATVATIAMRCSTRSTIAGASPQPRSISITFPLNLRSKEL
jgi:hypothetical protein